MARTRMATMTVAAMAVGVLVACGSEEAEDKANGGAAPKGVFVGTVTGADAFIAVVSDGQQVRGGYLCDGKELSTWFDADQIEGNGADLVSRQGDDLGDVTLSGGGVTGEAQVGGEAVAFNALPATGDAGLYRAVHVEEDDGELGEGEAEVGWIVLPDGSQRGSTNFTEPTTLQIVSRPAPKLATGTTQVNVQNFGSLAVDKLTSGFAQNPA